MTFKHSGATGDIIFSLPTIKALGGGRLYITNFHQQRAESIKKLIEIQPYITDVVICDDAVVDHDLNKFRDVFKGAYDSIIEAHFRGQDIAVDNSYKNGWLILPPSPPLKSNFSIINRTARYNDSRFDWSKELEYLYSISERVIFLGYKDEYESFCNQFGKVEYIDCDFLYAAYLIRNAVMYSGGYSAMTTIAQGLGRTYRIEQAPDHTCSTLFVERETIINK
jgi:hypothetical protein